MSYNGSGTFNINTAGQPVVTGTVISSTAFNALTADLGTGLSTAITKDGQTTATARIPFAQGINSSLVTDATSTTTGSIITAGGVGIAKALFVGTTANIAGTTTLAGVTATSITDSGLTSGRVTYAGTAGLLQDSANLTFNGTTLTANTIGAFTLSGTVAGGGNQLNNVIIGTTTPLAGAFTTLSATGQISGTKNDGVQGLFYGYCPDGAAVGTDVGCIQIGNYSTAKGQFQYTTAGHVFIDNTYNSTNGHIKLRVKTAGTPVVALDASDTGVAVTGTLSATGTGKVGTTLGVGAATPSASGAGITFPATQSASTDANTLDDYEEGSWTPSLGGTATYSSQIGRYTKVGRMVTINFDIIVAILGTGSTTVISGIPFTASATGVGRGSSGYFQSLAVNVIALTCYVDDSASTIGFFSIAAAGGTATINPAIFGNGARVQGSVCYFA